MSNETTKYERTLKVLDKDKRTSPLYYDCDKVTSVSKRYVYVLFLILIITMIPLTWGALRGVSSIIEIKYDFTNLDVNPTQNIKITPDNNTDVGIIVNPNHATFTPFLLRIDILYPLTEQFVNTEMKYGQFPNRIVDSELKTNIMNYSDKYEDYFFGSLNHLIDTDQPVDFKYRISADYSILIQVYVKITFDDPNIPSTSIVFVYVNDHLGTGETTFQLIRGNTLLLDINNLYYDYSNINAYFQLWSNTPYVYPFLIEGTMTNSFNWNNFWGEN